MKKNTKKNGFTLRFTDAKVALLFDELLATKSFQSKNVLVNKIIASGIEDFAQRYLPNREPVQPKSVMPEHFTGKDSRDLKQMKGAVEDMHVITMIQERLIASLYNTKLLELEGKKVSAEELASGMLADLPEAYQEMKDQVVKLRVKRINENSKGVDDE